MWTVETVQQDTEDVEMEATINATKMTTLISMPPCAMGSAFSSSTNVTHVQSVTRDGTHVVSSSACRTRIRPSTETVMENVS